MQFATDIRTDEGQALVEYTLILLLVALLCVAGLSSIGASVSAFFEAVVGAF